jgi:hypothetical protein
MSLTLASVAFNHDSASVSNGGINIRRNASVAVVPPEWRRGISRFPGDSPAAYSMRATAGKAITVQAELVRTDAGSGSLEVRPVDASVPGGVRGMVRRLAARVLRASPGNQARSVLGEAKPAPVVFAAGALRTLVSIEFPAHRIGQAGVISEVVTWRWQSRPNRFVPWRDFDASTHQLFVVLDAPTAPWSQAPFTLANTQIPWVDVLDHACRWARGARSADEAASLITFALNTLGGSVLAYNCVGLGSACYSWPYFDCTAFLQRLQGGPGNGPLVNCSDCAAVVSTFANCLGADLWQSKMGFDFALNPVRLVGSASFERACGLGRFAMHEVAWTGAGTERDRVFDACLQVDADLDPTRAPRRPLVAAGVPFGGPQGYRDMLATPALRAACVARPETRMRRFVI